MFIFFISIVCCNGNIRVIIWDTLEDKYMNSGRASALPSVLFLLLRRVFCYARRCSALFASCGIMPSTLVHRLRFMMPWMLRCLQLMILACSLFRASDNPRRPRGHPTYRSVFQYLRRFVVRRSSASRGTASYSSASHSIA